MMMSMALTAAEISQQQAMDNALVHAPEKGWQDGSCTGQENH